MKRTTLLVDGDYLIKRSFTAPSNHFTPAFGSMNALFNFFLTLRSIAAKTSCNKIVIAWDGENSGKMRYNIYNGYKANRKNKSWYNKVELSEAQIRFEQEKEKSYLKQKIRIQQYLEELFVRQIYNLDFIEGDDIIAFYVKEFHKDEHITIFTNDRDICQMIEYDGVNLIVANKKVTINKSNYFLYFKHHYKNLRLLKTFCGDSSDNIKGVKGLQETTFLTNFPESIKREMSVNEIIEQAKLIKEERIKDKKKPLLVIDNIIKGINSDKEELGNELYDINYQLVNLLEPFLTREAKHAIKEEGMTPLNDEDRGSKNLLQYMEQDQFLTLWNGGISMFCQPFYPTIIKEKDFYKKSKLI